MLKRFTCCWLLLLLVGCATTASRTRPVQTAADPSDDPLIYVVRRGWHIDIGLRAADLTPPLSRLLADLPESGWILIGFGDRHYLLAGRPRSSSLLAALWPGPGVLLITGLRDSPQAATGAANVITIHVTERQLTELQRYLAQSFADSQPLRIGPYPGSLYYPAVAHYSATQTCNTWAARGLHDSGMPVDYRGVLFADQLWRQLLPLAMRPDTVAPAVR